MTYAARSDMESVFGKDNVRHWADLDNDQNETNVAARIARAIVVATADLHDQIRGSKYRLPLTITTTADSDALAKVVDTHARIAGIWLYDNSGMIEVSEEGKRLDLLTPHRAQVEKTITEIIAGKRQLDCLLKDDVEDIPEAVS